MAAAAPRTLWPAMTGVWDLPSTASPRTLRYDGPAPLWVAGIDAGQRVSQAEVISGRGTLQVKPEVTRLAVTALWGTVDTGLVGWQADTALRQIGSQALLGDGVVVRPQSPGGLPRRRSSRGRRVFRELGVTTGRQLIERTWTQDVAGHVRRGWVETYLPAWCQAVVASVVPESGPDDLADVPGLQARFQHRRNGRPVAAVTPATAEFHGSETRVTWRFLLPGAAQSAGQLAVRIGVTDGWRLDGVFGYATLPATWASWPPPRTGQPRAGAPAPSRVWWE